MRYLLLLSCCVALNTAATPAAAFGLHRHVGSTDGARAHRRRAHDERVIHASEEPLGSGERNPYADYHGPGSVVLNKTERARSEPGVTLELAPDAKETATGGPVGGVPGYDGS